MPRTVPDTIDRDPGIPDPNHHLWRNGRLWWVAFTVHLPGWKKERVRVSLGTSEVTEARRRRDALLRVYPERSGCALSLRIGGRPVRAGTAEPMRRPQEGCAA
jgi:hypothetical protein